MVDHVKKVLGAHDIPIVSTKALLPAQLRNMDRSIKAEEMKPGGVGKPLEVPFGIDLGVVEATHARFPGQVLYHPRGGSCEAWELLHPSAARVAGEQSTDSNTLC